MADILVARRKYNFAFLASILSKTRIQFPPPMNSVWADTVVNGSVTGNTYVKRTLASSATGSSSALTYVSPYKNWTNAGADGKIDWSLGYVFNMGFLLGTADAQTTRRIQVKEATALGQLAEFGVGLQIVNLAATGEAYGTSRGTVSLATTFTANKVYTITILLTASGVEFFIDGVSKGSITGAGTFPSSASPVGDASIVASAENGTTAADRTMEIYPPSSFQGMA